MPKQYRPLSSPSKTEVYRAATAYRKSGLSLIPIAADGRKTPAFELLPVHWCSVEQRIRRPWGGYRQRQPTQAEIRAWYRDSDAGTDYGMAVIAGAVSGNLEIIDLDNWDVVKPWMALVRERAPELLKRLVRVKTPRPGMHAYYRCSTISGSQKLARVPDPEQDGKKSKTLIETKGEGGYCVAPPSPAGCHKSGRCYQFIDKKDFTQVSLITPKQREILLACARELNTWIDPPRPQYRPPSRAGAVESQGGRPGDDFNRRADWGEILTKHGWSWAGRGSWGSDLWTRPGKRFGVSATTDYQGSGLLYVFSSNAHPFEESTAYSKFRAYTLLNHYGNFSDAACSLARKGYGGGIVASAGPVSPFARYAGYSSQPRGSTK